MNRIVLALLSFLLSQSVYAFDWDSFTPPPRNVPFVEGGVTYNAFVQTRHTWYAQNYIVYYPAGISTSLKPVAVDYNQGAPYQHLWILLNPASQSQAYDSSDYNPDVIVYTCTGNTACGDNTWGSPVSSSQIRYRQYTWFDWNYAGPTGYDLQSDLVRAVGIDIKVNFGYAWGGQLGLSTLSANDVVITGLSIVPPSITSPVYGQLEVKLSNQSCTSPATKWCFYQHETGAHTSSGGVGSSNDVKAWDANLNYPNFDSDNGVAVYAVADGKVAATYAGSTNAGGTTGQVLIEHVRNGNKWWSGYLHMTNIQVGTGNTVTTGTVLGYVSSTGTNNNHLHLVVYKGASNASATLISEDITINEK